MQPPGAGMPLDRLSISLEYTTLSTAANGVLHTAGESRDATPLWATLAFTFVNSFGTGLVTSGIYYLTKSANGYAFSDTENLWLAVAIGVTYILGAKTAGPLMRVMRRASPSMTSRRFLLLLIVVMGLLCMIPPALSSMGVPPRSLAGIIGLGVLALVYSPASGMLWPTVESYVSGGRRGETLRSAIGIWNVVWSSAIPLSYWGMSGLVESRPIAAFLGLGFVHLAAAALLLWFRREPAPHLSEGHTPHPPVYEQLLAALRLMLPVAYVMSSALGPILPGVLAQLGVREAWRPIIGSAWLVPRVLTFWVMKQWHGWHGTWWTPIIGGVLLLAGFAGSILAPLNGESEVTIWLIVGSLVFFGIGIAALYAAAIYYAMEVGQAEVDAGGTHEALIGVGYTLGPLCGLGGVGLVSAHVIEARYREAAVVALVVLLVIAAGLFGLRLNRRKPTP